MFPTAAAHPYTPEYWQHLWVFEKSTSDLIYVSNRNSLVWRLCFLAQKVKSVLCTVYNITPSDKLQSIMVYLASSHYHCSLLLMHCGKLSAVTVQLNGAALVPDWIKSTACWNQSLTIFKTCQVPVRSLRPRESPDSVEQVQTRTRAGLNKVHVSLQKHCNPL